MRDNKAALARLETLDAGKPLDESAWDMEDVAACFEYYAGLAGALDARQVWCGAGGRGQSRLLSTCCGFWHWLQMAAAAACQRRQRERDQGHSRAVPHQLG